MHATTPLSLDEIELIHLTLRKFTTPQLAIDTDVLRAHLDSVTAEKAMHLQNLGVDKSVILSRAKFAEYLKQLDPDVVIPMKPGKRGPTYAFGKNDPGFMELFERPRLWAAVTARVALQSTQEETRTRRMIGIAESTGGALPVALVYYAAHTGRFGGTDKTNMQNLGRKSLLRKAIKPLRPGDVVLAGDLSQIEARIVATLAGQWDLVDAFAAGRDVYSEFASRHYGYHVHKDTHVAERFVGKTCILSLGFQAGDKKFHYTMNFVFRTPMSALEAQRIVELYRSTYPRIRDAWYTMNDLIQAMYRGHTYKFGPVTTGKGFIRLPNGMRINYPGLHKEGREWFYRGKNGQTKLYGGKCIAEGTDVLTARGWIPIQSYVEGDLLWDGHEWVYGGRLIDNGYKPVIEFAGSLMTGDHLVLNVDGWKAASQSKESDRAPVCLPEGSPFFFQQEWQDMVGRELYMRQPDRSRGGGVNESTRPLSALVRVQNIVSYLCGQYQTWYDKAPRLRGVAVDVGQMLSTLTPSVPQLWSQRHPRLRAVAEKVRALLGRHGCGVRTRADAGSDKQQQRVFSEELSLGGLHCAGIESAREHHVEHASGCDVSGAGGGSLQDQTEHDVLPRKTHATARVFDIANVGARNQFVVRGTGGELTIVHNCFENIVQALARIVVTSAEVRLARAGMYSALSVHDELVYAVPAKHAETYKLLLERELVRPVKWLPELPVACEVKYGPNYGACK